MSAGRPFPGFGDPVDLRLNTSPGFGAVHTDEKHLVVVGHGVPQRRLHRDADRFPDRSAVPVAAHDLADEVGDGEVRASGVLLANVPLDGFGVEAGYGAPLRRFCMAQ